MERSTRSGHASTLVLLAAFAATTLTLGGDLANPVIAAPTASAAASWTVTGSGEAQERLPVETTGFTIGGDVPGLLVPGRVVAMNLRLTNTTHIDLKINRLTVTVTQVSKNGRPSTCRPADFVVEPARLERALPLRARTSTSIGSLGLHKSRWPRIGLLNLPVNQNDCKGVALTLKFSGSARPVQR